MNRDKLLMVLGAVLFISLATNFFMAGLMLSHSYTRGGGEQQREGDGRGEWQKRDEELRRKLSDADRGVLKAAMQQHRPQIQALKQALDDARQKVAQAQNAEPFDKAALDAALRDESDKKTALLQTIRQTRDEISKQLSPEGQAVFSKLGPGSRFGGGGDGPWRGGRWSGRRGFDGDGPPRGDSAPSGGQPGPAPQP